MSVLVVCPTRDRPELALRMVQSFRETTTDAQLVMMVDDDQASTYQMPEMERVEWVIGPRRSLVEMLNDEALKRRDYHTMFGLIADDCVLLTPGWDKWMEDEKRGWPDEVGVACLGHNFGQMFDMPFVSQEWIRRLGWFAKPCFKYWGWPTYNIMLGEMTRIVQGQYYLRHDELGPQYWEQLDSECRVFYDQCSFFIYHDVRKLRGN